MSITHNFTSILWFTYIFVARGSNTCAKLSSPPAFYLFSFRCHRHSRLFVAFPLLTSSLVHFIFILCCFGFVNNSITVGWIEEPIEYGAVQCHEFSFITVELTEGTKNSDRFSFFFLLHLLSTRTQNLNTRNESMAAHGEYARAFCSLVEWQTMRRLIKEIRSTTFMYMQRAAYATFHIQLFDLFFIFFIHVLFFFDFILLHSGADKMAVRCSVDPIYRLSYTCWNRRTATIFSTSTANGEAHRKIVAASRVWLQWKINILETFAYITCMWDCDCECLFAVNASLCG